MKNNYSPRKATEQELQELYDLERLRAVDVDPYHGLTEEQITTDITKIIETALITVFDPAPQAFDEKVMMVIWTYHRDKHHYVTYTWQNNKLGVVAPEEYWFEENYPEDYHV